MNSTTMRVKICAAAATIIAALTLTACGGGGNNAGKASDDPSTATSTLLTLSQAFEKKNSIWFVVSPADNSETFGKDTQIGYVLVLDGNKKMRVYDTYFYQGFMVKDLKGLSDSEIIERTKTVAEEAHKRHVKYGGWDNAIPLDEALEPKPVPYNLSIETDSSGNATSVETFAFKTDSVEKSLELTSTMPATQVYDMLFSGFTDEDGETVLFTRLGQSRPVFTLDQPDTPGIKIND